MDTTISAWNTKVVEPTIDLRREIGDAKTMQDMAKLVGEAKGKLYFDKFRGIIGEFKAEETGLMEERKASNETTVTTTLFLVQLLMGAALVLGTGIAWVVGRGVADPIINMTGVMKTLASGDTSVDIPGLTRKD